MKNEGKTAGTKGESLLPQTVEGGNGGGKCGVFGRIILLLLPIVGASTILAVLYLLLYRLNLTIQETSISAALAMYEPYWEILAPLSIGVFATFVVTVSRNIQIEVYHRRLNNEYKGMRVLNFITTVANIGAYIGFLILAIYKSDDESEDARNLHMYGAVAYFVLSGFYGVAHIYLLCKQSQYPLYSKIVFTLVPIVAIVCSIVFAIEREDAYPYEWLAVALNSLFSGLFTTLFIVDPVDDEVRDFFCCSSNKRTTKSVTI
ncbi:hypothetical protein ACHAXS_005310 [Conticribra weissflogii]